MDEITTYEEARAFNDKVEAEGGIADFIELNGAGAFPPSMRDQAEAYEHATDALRETFKAQLAKHGVLA